MSTTVTDREIFQVVSNQAQTEVQAADKQSATVLARAETLGGFDANFRDTLGLNGPGAPFDMAALGDAESNDASAFAKAIANILTQNPELAGKLLPGFGGAPGTGPVSNKSEQAGQCGQPGQAGQAGQAGQCAPAPAPAPAAQPSQAACGPDAAKAQEAAAAAALNSKTKDGYTVDNAVADMKSLQKAMGTPERPEAQLRQIADAIIKGVNDYFPKAEGKAAAQALISSAFQDTQFDPKAPGGIFKMDAARLAEFNATNKTNFTAEQLSTSGDPSEAINISLAGMAQHGARAAAAGTTSASLDPTMQAVSVWHDFQNSFQATEFMNGVYNGVNYLENNKVQQPVVDTTPSIVFKP